jgi:hypothetical protein
MDIVRCVKDLPPLPWGRPTGIKGGAALHVQRFSGGAASFRGAAPAGWVDFHPSRLGVGGNPPDAQPSSRQRVLSMPSLTIFS